MCPLSAQEPIVTVDSLYSKAVGQMVRYKAVLPDGYSFNSDNRYNVMYLLHGHTGNYISWISYAQLPLELATRHNCIIVMPDGGNSWYVNWTGQTDGRPHLWEDMLAQDLVSDVDKKFRTHKDKAHRGIGGLSMGGFGALSVGLKNPEIFGFVFSSAGAINFCKNIMAEMAGDTLDWNSPQLWSDDTSTIPIKGFGTQQERTPKGLVFKTKADATRYDPYTLLSKLESKRMPYIHIDCGTRDDFYGDALEFVAALATETDRFSFLVLPGEHEAPYWEQAVRHTFSIFDANLKTMKYKN